MRPYEPQPSETWSGKGQQIPARSNSGVVSETDYGADYPEIDANSAEENILKITDVIGGTLARLFRVCNAARKTAEASQTLKVENFKINGEAGGAIDELRLHTGSYIDSKFPRTQKALRSALIEANALRFQRLCYQRSHQKRTDVGIERLTKASNLAVSDDTKTVKSMSAVKPAPGAPPKPATTHDFSALSPPSVTIMTPAQVDPIAAFHANYTSNVSGTEFGTLNSKPWGLYTSLMQDCPVCGVVLDLKGPADTTIWQ